MFDIQFDGLYDGSKICDSEDDAVIFYPKSFRTNFSSNFFFLNVVAKKRKIDCNVDRDHHL